MLIQYLLSPQSRPPDPNPTSSPQGPHSPDSSSMTEPAPLLLPSCLPLSTPLPPPYLNIPCGAAPAIWEVAIGEAPGDICLPCEGAPGLQWARHSCCGQGLRQPLPLGPAVSFPHPTTILAAGMGQAQGLPHSAIGCHGGLEGAGKQPGPEGLSYPKNAALGEPSQGWTRGGHSLLEARDGQGGREQARRARESWVGGVVSEE